MQHPRLTRIAVIGLGRVGLPFALFAARRGCVVYGFDKDPARVAACRRGDIPFRIEISRRQYSRLLGSKFFPVNSVRDIGDVHVWVIAVAGGHRGDFVAVKSSFRTIAPHLRPGQCVIVRSTLPPGGTKTLTKTLSSALERLAAAGMSNVSALTTPLRVGKTIFLAYCPERALEGRVMREAPRLPQIIGADDPASALYARRFFSRLKVKTLVSGSSAAVEFAKLFSNTYRYATFALANEFAQIAERAGENIFEILRLVNEKYPRGGIPRPGFVGGPCLPKSASMLARAARSAHLIGASQRVNASLPRDLASRIRRHFGDSLKNCRIAILGISFKGNVDDARGSSALEAERIFRRWGADVRLHDPFLRPVSLASVLRRSDAIFVGADHDVYRRMSIRRLRNLVGKSALVCDVWNVFGTGKVFFQL